MRLWRQDSDDIFDEFGESPAATPERPGPDAVGDPDAHPDLGPEPVADARPPAFDAAPAPDGRGLSSAGSTAAEEPPGTGLPRGRTVSTTVSSHRTRFIAAGAVAFVLLALAVVVLPLASSTDEQPVRSAPATVPAPAAHQPQRTRSVRETPTAVARPHRPRPPRALPTRRAARHPRPAAPAGTTVSPAPAPAPAEAPTSSAPARTYDFTFER